MLSKLKNLLFQRKREYIFILITIIFFIIRYGSFAIDIYFPDEIWHTSYMREIPNLDNYQGFGSTYWLIGNFLSFLSENYKLYLRILSLFSICLSGLFVTQLIKNNSFINIFLLIFYLTTPFLWYEGKLITPEFYTLPLVFYSLRLILIEKNYKLSFLIIGFCIGIKSSIMPIYLPLLLYLLNFNITNITKIRIYLKSIAFTFIGFVVASPNILYDPVGFYYNIPRRFNLVGDIGKNGIPEIINYKFYLYKLNSFFLQGSTISKAWDHVTTSGFFSTVISLTSVIIISFFIFIYAKKFNKLSYFISIFIYIYIMLLQGYFLWHYYAIIPLIIFYFVITLNDGKNQRFFQLKRQKIFLSLLLTICIILNINNILKFSYIDSNLKYQTYKNILSNDQNTKCLIDFIDENLPKESILIDATTKLETSNGKTLLDSNYLKSNYNYFLPFSKDEDLKKIINDDNDNAIYLISFQEYENIKNYDRYKMNTYLNTVISTTLENKLDAKTIHRCNKINLSKIVFVNE